MSREPICPPGIISRDGVGRTLSNLGDVALITSPEDKINGKFSLTKHEIVHMDKISVQSEQLLNYNAIGFLTVCILGTRSPRAEIALLGSLMSDAY